ncbi:MAG: biopolymer transporter ExbD [Candidatus Ozemobacteraceae bacterium]
MSLRRKPQREGISLDMTTCSDIIFTLLLFYILTQNFMTQFPLQLPRLEANDQPLSQPQRIEVVASGAIFWNDMPLGPNWEPAIQKKTQTMASSTPILFLVHRQAPAGIVVELLDRLRTAGITQVAFGGVPLNKTSEAEK